MGMDMRYADGGAFYAQLHEVFLQGAYDFSPDSRSPVLVDCGAHVGLVSIRWSKLFRDAEITAVEADPEIAAMLAHNLGAAGATNCRVLTKAAWTHDRGVSFHRSGVDDGHVNDGGQGKDELVPSLDLAELMPDVVDFLKMDVEGAEFQLLPHLAARGKLQGVRRIFLELHEWGGETSRIPEAMHLLQKEGFDCRVVGSVLFKPPEACVFSEEGWANSHVLVAGRRFSP
jgi:FkbM family methyltransferase